MPANLLLIFGFERIGRAGLAVRPETSAETSTSGMPRSAAGEGGVSARPACMPAQLSATMLSSPRPVWAHAMGPRAYRLQTRAVRFMMSSTQKLTEKGSKQQIQPQVAALEV